MKCKLLVLISVVNITVTACTTTRVLDNPDMIADTGKTNTTVLSYDLTLKTFERHPQANIVRANMCQASGDKSGIFTGFTKNQRCFSMLAEFAGAIVSDTGVVFQTFAVQGVDAHQKKYGEYAFNSVNYSVLIDKQPKVICREQRISKKNKRTKTECHTEVNNVYKNYRLKLPTPITFHVNAGSGCYLGHISMNAQGDDLVSYDIDKSMESIDYTQIAETVRPRVQSHVTRTCDL